MVKEVLFLLVVKLALLPLQDVAHQALGGVEQVDGAVSVRDESGREAQALKQFDLHLRTGGGDGTDGVLSDGHDLLLELLGLNAGNLTLLGHLQVVLLAQVLKLGLAGLAEPLELGFLYKTTERASMLKTSVGSMIDNPDEESNIAKYMHDTEPSMIFIHILRSRSKEYLFTFIKPTARTAPGKREQVAADMVINVLEVGTFHSTVSVPSGVAFMQLHLAWCT